VYLYECPKVKVWQRCPDDVIYSSVLFLFFPSVYVQFDVI